MEEIENKRELEFRILDRISLHHYIDNFIALESTGNGFFCIITNVGLYVLHFRGYMNNILKVSSITKMFFKTSDYTIGDKLGININDIIDLLSQYDMYEATLRADISPNLKLSEKVQVQPIAAKFSPSGLISNTHCLIGVLTNYGSLELYVGVVKVNFIEEFVCVANVSRMLVDNFKKDWVNVENEEPETKFEEFKRRADLVMPTAFAWSNLITYENKSFAILIVGHHKGRLTFWKINSRTANDLNQLQEKVPMLGQLQTSLNTATTIQWIKAENDALLLVADNTGKLSSFCVFDITNSSLSFSEEIIVWDQADYIKVDFFKIYHDQDKFYLFIVKRIHLIILAIDQDGNTVDKTIFVADNFQITAVEHYESNIYFVLTYSGALFQLQIAWKNNKIIILRRYIHLKVNWSIRRAVGLYISPNKVFIGILAPLFKLRNIRRIKEQVRFLIMKNVAKDPLAILMNSQDDSIKNYWDCFEILRLHGIIERRLPCHGLPQIVDYDSFSLAKLKTYLWLAKSSEMLIDRIYFIQEYNIKSYSDIKSILEIRLTIKHMEDLLLLYKRKKKLTDFQLLSLYLHNMYLKETVLDGTIEKLGLGKITINSAIKVLRKSNKLKYMEAPSCFVCGEKFTSSRCSRSHVDNRCSISNVQILWPPYYKCPFCKCNVHKKVDEEYCPVICPYCDIDMVYIRSTEIIPNGTNRSISSCKMDCDRSTVEDCDIEISAFEGIRTDVEHLNVSDVDEKEELEVME